MKFDEFLTNVMQGNRKAVAEAIKVGQDVNEVDKEGLTALHWAAVFNRYEIVVLLLANRANKFTKSFRGFKAVQLAELFGYSEVSDVIKAA